MNITKCKGLSCPVKEQCKRFTVEPNEFKPSYFLEPPYEHEAGEFTCNMYWGVNQTSMFDQLKDIMK